MKAKDGISIQDRCRINVLALAAVALSQVLCREQPLLLFPVFFHPPLFSSHVCCQFSAAASSDVAQEQKQLFVSIVKYIL